MPKPPAFPFAAALLISCILAHPARSQTAPQTAPAADAAKAALADFYKLMYNADPKALDHLIFTDPQTEKAGRTLVQLALAKPYSACGFSTKMRVLVRSSGAQSVSRSNSTASSGL